MKARLPYEEQKYTAEMQAMGSINYTDNYREWDMADSNNISARRYPYIATRRKSVKNSEGGGRTAVYFWNKLFEVVRSSTTPSKARLVWDGVPVNRTYFSDTGVSTEPALDAGAKQFAVVNSKAIIWPDKMCLSLSGDDEEGTQTVPRLRRMSVKVENDPFSVVDSVASRSGTYRIGARVLHSTDSTPKGVVKIAMSSGNTMQLMTDTDEIITETTDPDILEGDLVKITIPEIEVKHYIGDTTIDGVPVSDYTETAVIPKTQVIATVYDVAIGTFSDGKTFQVQVEGTELAEYAENARKIVNNLGATSSEMEEAGIKKFVAVPYNSGANTSYVMRIDATKISPIVEKYIPDMDFICASDNRLYGCSSKDQTIYASALGDPTDFVTAKGVDTDYYAAAVGSQGDFTGCCKLGSSVLFWKETKLHKLLGQNPSEYALYEYEIDGVKPGCHKSQVVINDTLYYLGRHGVYRYNGGTPVLISESLGTEDFTEAVGGTDGRRYLLSVYEGETPHLFVYDPFTGIWTREADIKAVDMTRNGKTVYMACADGRVYIYDTGEDDPDMEWSLTFKPFYETIQGRKRTARLLVRTEMPRGSYYMIDVRTDGGLWQEVARVIGKENDVSAARVPINRCDKYEIRIHGKGPCTILGISREFMVGSEV